MYYYCLYMFVWVSTNNYAEETKISGNYGTHSGKICSNSGNMEKIRRSFIHYLNRYRVHSFHEDKFKTQDKQDKQPST